MLTIRNYLNYGKFQYTQTGLIILGTKLALNTNVLTNMYMYQSRHDNMIFNHFFAESTQTVVWHVHVRRRPRVVRRIRLRPVVMRVI